MSIPISTVHGSIRPPSVTPTCRHEWRCRGHVERRGVQRVASGAPSRSRTWSSALGNASYAVCVITAMRVLLAAGCTEVTAPGHAPAATHHTGAGSHEAGAETGLDAMQSGAEDAGAAGAQLRASQSDALSRPDASVRGAEPSSGMAGTAGDPCLTDNGGCPRNAYCEVTAGEVLCRDCPRSALDDDGECGPALEALSVAEGALDQAFDSTQRTYRVSVPLTVQVVNISARARGGAALQINGHSVGEPGQAYRSELLSVGDTHFDIIVRGQDAHDRRYDLTVQRTGALTGYLKGDDTDETDNFGRSIALASGRVAVGAFYADGLANAAEDVGAVYVYKREDGTYKQLDRLYPGEPETWSFFGSALALADDTLLVGASYARVLVDQMPAPGRVYVYKRQGERWNEHAVLRPSQGRAGDWFGISVALSGRTAAIGASNDGAVYVYEEVGGTWEFSQRLTDGTSESAAARFGASVALQADTLVVGAPARDGGRAYVFARDSSGAFAGAQRLAASGTGAASSFGSSVTVYEGVIAVGAPGRLQADFGFSGSDAVYVFDRKDESWRARPLPVTSTQPDNSAFGMSVVLLSQTTLAVGAPNARASGRVFGAAAGDTGVPVTGGVYVFGDLGDGFALDLLLNAAQPGAGDWFGYALAADGGSIATTAMHEGSASRMVDGDAADNSCTQCGAAYVFE